MDMGFLEAKKDAFDSFFQEEFDRADLNRVIIYEI
jgi:hypothetical protein